MVKVSLGVVQHREQSLHALHFWIHYHVHGVEQSQIKQNKHEPYWQLQPVNIPIKLIFERVFSSNIGDGDWNQLLNRRIKHILHHHRLFNIIKYNFQSNIYSWNVFKLLYFHVGFYFVQQEFVLLSINLIKALFIFQTLHFLWTTCFGRLQPIFIIILFFFVDLCFKFFFFVRKVFVHDINVFKSSHQVPAVFDSKLCLIFVDLDVKFSFFDF